MHPGVLVLGGVVLGVAGTKAVCSKMARKVAVKTLVTGMKAKEGVMTLIDDARIQFDDLMAEASDEKAASDLSDNNDSCCDDEKIKIKETVEEISE